MEQEQSEIIEYFVKKTFASSNANALPSILVEATSHRNLFTFSEILSLPYLQQLKATENSVYLDMLRLFAYGTWSDYTKNAGRLPQLIPDQILKLKQLTVLTLASTYEGLVRGKLDHLRQCFVVQFAACRDLRPAKLGSMIETLSNWLSTSENLLVSIQEKIKWADDRDEIEKKHRKCVEDNLREVKNTLVKANSAIRTQEDNEVRCVLKRRRHITF
ncbi:COP9 signalosome complex subunit 7-like isoform X2 [Phaseolus vulgaris]|uniref:COP9 signalosome complex subunit 7-like isoform X2 n=1 Tax=Phaseolus vulgaris TaxID=3885 RepID=UPI0035CAA05F